MEQIEELIKLLESKGYQEGADDIKRMLSDKEYADEVNFPSQIQLEELPEKVLPCLFCWDKSTLGHKYWSKINNKL